MAAELARRRQAPGRVALSRNGGLPHGDQNRYASSFRFLARADLRGAEAGTFLSGRRREARAAEAEKSR